MPQEQFPGVYIAEQSFHPRSVVPVPTSVPAFLGYTETAQDGTNDLTRVPTRISTMQDYERLFGGPPGRVFRRVNSNGSVVFAGPARDFLLYRSLQLYFANGGGPCWIVSVGNYVDSRHDASDFRSTDYDVWERLAEEQEPAIYVVPDAVKLSPEDYKTVSEAALTQCQKLRSRVAILDIYEGWKPQMDQVIDGPNGFRKSIAFGAEPSFGMAYYPWLNTTIVPQDEMSFMALDPSSRTALASEIKAEFSGNRADQNRIKALADEITHGPQSPDEEKRIHDALMAASKTYQTAIAGLLEAVNVLPPSGAMAGVFVRNDMERGVFHAPANTMLSSVTSPMVTISDQQQGNLNVPLDGYAVNAIRYFTGRGVLVWGARTLDGNSYEHRYISVRRMLIMLEQSIVYALKPYAFEPNAAETWRAVQSMIEDFLAGQWRAGALLGTTSKDCCGVSVGLGSTMTANDIAEGVMRVEVRIALVHPAEFQIISIMQRMQPS